jgi:hypothetical protein
VHRSHDTAGLSRSFRFCNGATLVK